MIIFTTGLMGTGKSANIINTINHYDEHTDDNAWVVSAAPGAKVISSRDGRESPAHPLPSVEYWPSVTAIYDVVIIDEAQFMPQEHVDALLYCSVRYGTQVLAYGLLRTFKATLFEGSAGLIAVADRVFDIPKPMCTHSGCDHASFLDAKFRDGRIVRSGPDVEINQDSLYHPVCRYHYVEGTRL